MKKGDVVKILVDKVPGSGASVIKHYECNLGIIKGAYSIETFRVGVIGYPNRHAWLFNIKDLEVIAKGPESDHGVCSSIW